MATIDIELPLDRRKLGKLRIINRYNEVLYETEVLGRAASNLRAKKAKDNPNRNPLKQYGHTPLGIYRSTVVKPQEMEKRIKKYGELNAKIRKTKPHITKARYSYGQEGALILEPISGDAAVAAEIYNRSGILIHAGYMRPGGKLRPTAGCIRVSPDAMLQIISIIDMLRNADDPLLGIRIHHKNLVSIMAPMLSTVFSRRLRKKANRKNKIKENNTDIIEVLDPIDFNVRPPQLIERQEAINEKSNKEVTNETAKRRALKEKKRRKALRQKEEKRALVKKKGGRVTRKRGKRKKKNKSKFPQDYEPPGLDRIGDKQSRPDSKPIKDGQKQHRESNPVNKDIKDQPDTKDDPIILG